MEHPISLRPFWRRLAMILRPVLDFMRRNHPCLRSWTRRVLPCMVLRGPHRIWASAGCEVMADRGTRSEVAAASVAAGVVEGAKGEMFDRERKAVGRAARVGRRGVKEANVLRGC